MARSWSTGRRSTSFDAAHALAADGQLRPFDQERQGVLLGDGGGMLLLESGESLRARGARPLARLAGWAMTDDAFHVAQPHAGGAGVAAAVTRALHRGGIGADRLTYVNAHGTGTPLNDASEAAGLHAALGPDAERVFVSGTKSTTGHALEASGALESVITLLALRSSVLPPTAALRRPDTRPSAAPRPRSGTRRGALRAESQLLGRWRQHGDAPGGGMKTRTAVDLVAGAEVAAGPHVPRLAGFMASDFAPLVYAAARACLGDPKEPHLLDGIGDRVGIVLGSRRFDVPSLELSVEHVNRGRVSPILFYQVVPTAVLGQIARDYRLTGPVSCVAVTGDARAEVHELARVLLADDLADRVLGLTVEMSSGSGPAVATADLLRAS